MAKQPDQYLAVNPWAVIEEGFHQEKARVSESIFSLGNEYMGVRGYFDEGYSGDGLPGSYFNGVFEETDIKHPALFKGFSTRRCFMVNTVDWLYTRIYMDGEELDLAKSRFSGFVRRLDLRTGILTREFIWETENGKHLKLIFQRFLSMVRPHLGCQRLSIIPLDFSGTADIVSGLDFSRFHQAGDDFTPLQSSMGKNFWNIEEKSWGKDAVAMMGCTKRSGQRVFSSFRLRMQDCPAMDRVEGDKLIGSSFALPLRLGEIVQYDKLVVNRAEKLVRAKTEDVWTSGMQLAQDLGDLAWDEALAEHQSYWEKVWETSDIVIEGDPENQQGVRFCIFQLHQTYHGQDARLNVGAKGLTGESYDGATFWDTETYCLPFYVFNNPKAARNLLGYRYMTLPQAMERAKELDCRGACYPMVTIDGTESCGVWQHGNLEIHVSIAVAYGIWHYMRVCGDDRFLGEEGLEMLIQICRYLASRGQWHPRTGEFGFWGVMGPDEFHMMVHNNCYTNFMAKKSLEYTLGVIRELRDKAPELLSSVSTKVGLDPAELDLWHKMADNMRIPQNKETGLFEQHDGFFDLPHLDIQSIPVTQFPLYKHWAYDRIFRSDMIKQPDVLLLLFFFSQDFSSRVKQINYCYYEPRCINESSLSPGIHSILAAELSMHDKAYAYAGFASRLDLDNYNRNTEEGLHTTSMAATWMNVVYGFGGLRSDGDVLVFNPSIPRNWRVFSFHLQYRGSLMEVGIDRDQALFRILNGSALSIRVFGREYLIDEAGLSLPMPADRLG